MAFFEGNMMTGGYGDGPDIINSCTINPNKGEIVAILGPNGAGKSTAMKAMLGLLKLKSGNVLIAGEDINKLSSYDIVSGVAIGAFFIYYGTNRAVLINYLNDNDKKFVYDLANE